MMHDPRALAALAAKLRSLADDLEAASAGRVPDAAMLADSPFLDLWSLSTRQAPCLIGRRNGHPVLRCDGRPTVTSEVYFVDRSAGIARTFSRWYRLGRKHPGTGTVA